MLLFFIKDFINVIICCIIQLYIRSTFTFHIKINAKSPNQKFFSKHRKNILV